MPLHNSLALLLDDRSHGNGAVLACERTPDFQAWAAQADVAGLQIVLRNAAGDHRRQLLVVVSFIRRFYEQAADLVEVARGAGSTEPDLVALWKEGEGRRLHGQAPLVRAWANAGVLRDGLSKRDALDILWSLTGADNYRLFVVERGWTPTKYQAWLMVSLEMLLFR